MQNRRAFLFLLLAIVLGAAAAFTARRWLEEQARPADSARPLSKPVTVVGGDVAVGRMLSERDLVTVDWPIDFVPEGSFGQPAEVAGRVLRRPLASGEPVLESSLLQEGARGGLVSVIDPSQRAISVKVDPVVGVAGFVLPGARVDVLVTMRRVDRDQALPYTKVILQDIEVLAIDQKLEEARGAAPELVQVVTLEVSPQQAETLTYAVHEGRLQLALRNPNDRETVETQSIGVAEIFGAPAPKPKRVVRRAPAPRATTDVEVIKGAQVSVESF